MTTVKKEKWREKVFPAGREVKGENVKNKENRKRKNQKNKNKKWNFRPPYLQVLPLLLLMFSSNLVPRAGKALGTRLVFIFFFFFQVAQKFKSVFYM